MTVVEVEGRRLRLSSLDRVLWPETGFTKGEMIDYYAGVSEALLPHLAGRPVMLGRFPVGVEGPGWAQTECRGRPEWLATHPMRLRSGEVRSFCVLDDLPSLLWAANQGAIELHPLLLRRERPDETTTVVFDLDPTEPAGLVECCEVALLLRGALEGRGLTSFVKTSGAAGLHLFVPLGPGHGFGASKVFARSLAGALAAKRPGLVADKQRRSERVGQVLVDWLQNDPMRSTVAPYSLRATQIPSVSTPVAWEEVERALRLEQPDSLVFGPADVLERVARAGDLWAGAVEVSQTMPR